MRSSQSKTQSRVAARNGRIADGGNENASFAQKPGDFDRFIFIANHDRNDGACFGDLDLLRLPRHETKASCAALRRRCFARSAPRQWQRRRRRGGRGRKNKTARAIYQIVNQSSRAADVTTRNTKPLAQRSHLNFCFYSALLGQAASQFSIEAGGVRFVDHEPRAKLLLQRHQFAQRRLVAIHRKHALRDNKNSGRRSCSARISPAQDFFQFVQIVVAEHAQLRPAQTRRINDRSVGQFIDCNYVVAIEQCADGSESCRITSRKYQCRLGSL